MIQRGHCYPYPMDRDHTKIVECGPLGTAVRLHDRPDYTLAEAREVCHWLNGVPNPLPVMKARERDEWDPVNRRLTLSRFAGRLLERKGLAPIADKE